jgi:transposase
MKKYIGIELNREHFIAAFPHDYSQKYDIKRYKQSELDISTFVRSLSNNFVSIMENHGIYSVTLANQIYKAGFEVAIVHGVQLIHFAQTRFLKDKLDPVIISKYGEEMRPALYNPTPEFIEQISKGWEELRLLLHTKIGKRKKLHAIETSFKTNKEEEISRIKESIHKNEIDIKAMEEELSVVVNKFINPYTL